MWKLSGIFFIIILGILSGPGVLLFARFLRQMSYVSLSKYSCSGVCGFPLLSMIKSSRSCQGYCLIPHIQYGVCSGW